MGTKKSDFVAAATAADSDTFDFVSQGQNLKITKADLVALFGAIGTLEQLGDITGVPVLKQSGTVNQIRNIIGGAGILAALSGSDGVQISHNFTADASGVPVLPNPSADSPTIRSLIAGVGITIAATNGGIQITASGVPVASNVVVINEMSDFPTPAAGIITLEADTAYLVSASLTTTDRFLFPDGGACAVLGPDSTVSGLTYTGTDAMFTAVDGNHKLTLLSLNCPNGALLDIQSSSGDSVFQLVNSTVDSCGTIGEIGDVGAMQITDVAFNSITTDGLLFTGNCGVFFGTRNLFVISAGTVIDMGTAVFASGFSMESSFCAFAGAATFLSGAVDSGNMGTEALGTLFNCRFFGTGTEVSGIAVTDAQWEFLSNNRILDTKTAILATNAGATVIIAATDTPVIIGATWVLEGSSRFELTAGGRFTYTGKGASVRFNASITAESAGGSDDCTFYFYRNGVQIANSAIKRELVSGNPGNLSMIWGAELADGDYIEIFVENNDDTSNIIINKAIVRLS